jgi:glycosyltransferase involved in cell wall biosynthesis
MRILVMTSLFPNPFQPLRGLFNWHPLPHLANRDSVMALAPIPWPAELAGRWRGQASLPPHRQLERQGITVRHPSYRYPPGLLRDRHGAFYYWCVHRAFEESVADFRPDVVFAPWAYPDGWAAVQLGHEVGLPVVLKVLGSDILLLRSGSARWQQTAAALRQADGVVAVSRDLAGHVIGMGARPQRVRVIYDGVDPHIFHPAARRRARARLGLPTWEPIILFVGNLVPVKGIEVLIDACAMLAAEGANFKTYLVGQGPLRRALAQRIAGHGLQDRVILQGSMPQSRLPDWYRAANVLPLPSYSEGVPSVLLEAAACQLPFVASHVGGIPEIAHVGPNMLVSPGDPAALATALRHWLQQPTNGLAEPAVRTWSQVAGELGELFTQTLQTGSKAARPTQTSHKVGSTI